MVKERHQWLMERMRRTWPHFVVDVDEIFECPTPGWDYRVFYIRDWVLRMGISPPSNTHLRYEMEKLKDLHLSLPIPDYLWQASWGGLYKKIPGRPISPSELKQPRVQSVLAGFVGGLHDLKNLPKNYRSERIRFRWKNRYRVLEDALRVTVFPLLTVKQQRKAQEQFGQLFATLDKPWWPCLLHGDLSRDHILVEQGHITGVIDFGDLMMGDPALDWAGWEVDKAPSEYIDRIQFYRWVAPTYKIRYVLESGSVEEVERAMQEWLSLW